MPLLDVDGLQVSYGPIPALAGVSLHVDPGEFVAVIGPNGAGKSTLLKTVSGIVRPRAGAVRFDGADITCAGAGRIVRGGIGHCPEGRRLWPQLSVHDNLDLGGYIVRDRAEKKRRLEHVYELFPKLRTRRQQMAGTLSGGEQQMVAIGRVIMTGPRLMMFDEPSLGLSPRIVQDVMDILQSIARTGVAVLLVEQNAVVALSLSRRAYVLRQGAVVAAAESRALLADPNLLSMYLGSGHEQPA